MGTIAMEEYELMKDSKYRVYVSAVDKALKNFDYTSEWADLISALGKLNKVLLNYMKFPVIPRRIKISKRLAQCMHPALPSGVHLKALETYDIIFKCMGTNRLSHELFIYSAGLFPLLGHAAMNVRPSLLTVYETHFVPLGERLRPGLSGFLSGVLPGLEEGSDHFERTTSLLEKVCEGVGPPHFYGCLWDCLAANSGIRLPAISFVLSHFNKKLSMEDQLYIMGTNIDVMVSALCACVQDGSVLVQRSALDLLLVGFPMHNSQLVRGDMIRLVTAALVTILRRDMSLNRRLFAWLLGSEVNTSLLGAEHPLVKRPLNFRSYFDMYSRDMLVQAVKITLSQSLGQNPPDLRPYRLLVSLLDKQDIGPIILDDILSEVFRTLYLSCADYERTVSNGSPSTAGRGSHELLKAANLLFSSLEPCYIWQYTGNLFSNACQSRSSSGVSPSSSCTDNSENSDFKGFVHPVGNGPPDLAEVCQLTEFLLDSVSLEAYVETPGEHLPGLFLHIVTQLTERCGCILPSEAARALQLCAKILTRVQPPMLPVSTEPNPPSHASCDGNEPKSLSNISLETSPVNDHTSATLEYRSKSTSDLAAEAGNAKKANKTSKVKKLNAKLRLRPSKGSPLLLSVQPLESTSATSSDSALHKVTFCASTGHLNELEKLEISSSKITKSDDSQVKDKLLSIPVPSRQQSLLEQCLRQYEQFYVKFVGGQGVITADQIDKMFKELLVSNPRDTDDERTEKLEALLAGSVPSSSWHVTSSSKILPRISFSSNYDQWEEPMRVACSLLVELSTFPNYCLPEVNSLVSAGGADEDVLPEWLKVLVVLACWLTTTPSLQLIAISTLLDLMSLVRAPGGGLGSGAAGGSTPVVMVPLLKSWQMNFLEYRTSVVEILARALWQHLGQLQPHLQFTCVELLHQLHNVLLTSDAVEDVIGEALTQEEDSKKMEALQHFSLLWHLGRELETKNGSVRTLRTFDRSLLKMLDHLQRPECCPLRLQSQVWLLHSLVRGDVARLLDPLLLLLLEPNTARLSVLHVSIQHSNTVVTGCDSRCNDGPDERASARIYAISSVDGNVIYHVSEDSSNQKGEHRTARDNPVRAKRIFAVTTLVGGNSSKCYITEKNPHLREVDFPTSFFSKQNISVFVNPFAASHVSESTPEDDCFPESRERSASMPECLRHARRLHPPGRSISGSPTDLSPSNVTDDIKTNLSLQRRYSGDSDSHKDLAADNDVIDSSTNTSSTEGADEPQAQNWSAADDDFVEPDESTAAEDYFQSSGENSSIHVVQDILKEVLDKVAKQCSNNEEKQSSIGCANSNSTLSASSVITAAGVHPLHSHMLLYCGVYDSGRTLYALRTLRAVLLTHARMFLCAAATTGLAGQQAVGRRATGLQVLLARHRKSVFGRSFHGDLNSLALAEYSAAYRSSMYLEVLVSMCLYYARSFYPNLGQMRLTPEEIVGNRQVQLASAELLMLICSELIVIVRDSGRGFACYLADLMVRCKIQKVVLHCVVASVYDMSCIGVNTPQRTFTEEIVSFNDPHFPNQGSTKCIFRSSEHSEGFQIQLLRLLLALLMLEHQVNLQKGEDATSPSTKESKDIPQTKNPQQKYLVGIPIPEQPMFLSGILSALKMEHMRHLHQQWTALITSALPFLGSALTPVVMSVVSQLCINLEKLSQYYCDSRNQRAEAICCLPPDYAVTQLESLTLLCHYCLLDSAQQQSHAFSQPLLGGVGSAGVPGAGPGQVFNNLVHVFMPSPLQQETTGSKDKPGGLQDTLSAARVTMLSNLPRILASVASLWQAVLGSGDREQHSCVLGSARIVKHQLLELLSPISLHHGPHFLAAVAVTWQDRRPAPTSSIKVVPVAETEQQVLVSLVGALRVLPMDTLVQTVHSVLRQPPPIQRPKQDLSLEVSLLELFYCCLKGCAGNQLAESWGSLLPLLRDGLTLSPPAQFLLLAVLSEYVHRCPPLAERKDQRDLQDITAKLVESCAQIAGACLEQTTWLRRNLAVREEEPNVPSGRDKDNGAPASSNQAVQFSLQAQSVLAELLAPLLDVSYGSQEKEKVVALLTALMYNITPYLKNHTRRNVPSFQACSQLLASLSSYQYTRKAWRKDVFDLLLDPSLFQMEAHCLPLWRTIVDNLMTHDNTTFRDLMSRVSLAQSGSLSIFSSREQEYEQRAQLLKRLAFVLLCSEMDQYHKYMPEIQERLADSLRLPQVVPTVQAQVFLCFRVLLLRMSSQHITSLWPIIISELVQVFLHIEQELSTDSEEFRRNNSSHIRLLSALDSSWVVNSNNGLHAHGHPAWLQLQLSAAKLLDLALALPAHRLPQFQMYRWAFVGGLDGPSLNNNNQPLDESARSPDFVPHVARISKLMDAKFSGTVDPLPRLPGQLLLRTSSIHTMQELQPFFTSLSTYSAPTLQEWNFSLNQLEAALETDFLERLPSK